MERISGFEASQCRRTSGATSARTSRRSPTSIARARPELFQTAHPLGVQRADRLRRARRSRATSPTSRRRSTGVQVDEAFMPVMAPGSVALDDENLYYPNEEAYVAGDRRRRCKQEYRAIIDAGFLLQVDDAAIANMHDILSVDGEDKYLRWAESRIEALNYALEGIPEDRVRYHLCWGSWHGPHTTDVPLRTIVEHHSQGERPGVFGRGRQSAPRARVAGVGGRQAAGGQGADPGRDHPPHAGRRAPGRGGAAHRALRQHRRSRERDRQLRLRLRAGHADQRVHPSIAWAKLDVAGRRRPTRDQRSSSSSWSRARRWQDPRSACARSARTATPREWKAHLASRLCVWS